MSLESDIKHVFYGLYGTLKTNKNENFQKERRITKRTKIRRVIIRDKKSFCQMILQNLVKIQVIAM